MYTYRTAKRLSTGNPPWLPNMGATTSTALMHGYDSLGNSSCQVPSPLWIRASFLARPHPFNSLSRLAAEILSGYPSR